jgi:hypothetical protein
VGAVLSGGANMARPRKEIDKKQFENLCGLQCTKEEICAFFEITDKTLDGWCKRTYNMSFSDVFREKRGIGRISLRRSQFELAKKNATMAIWLGKQYLNQSDHVQIEVTKENNLLDVITAAEEIDTDDLPEVE